MIEESAHEKVLIFTKPKNVEKLGNIVASKVGDDSALRFVQTMTNLNTVINFGISTTFLLKRKRNLYFTRKLNSSPRRPGTH